VTDENQEKEAQDDLDAREDEE
jgi:hypothetical protein